MKPAVDLDPTCPEPGSKSCVHTYARREKVKSLRLVGNTMGNRDSGDVEHAPGVMSLSLAPLPLLVDLVALAIDLDGADLVQDAPFDLAGEVERAAHERLRDPLAG